MKICRVCNIEKETVEFERSKKVNTTNRCKLCANIATRERYRVSRLNPDNIIKERERGREKYRRLGNTKTYCPEHSKKATEKSANKYPEKYTARAKSRMMKAKKKGNHVHHWSYNEEHWKDIIELTPKLHYLIHRLMDYDQDTKMYRSALGDKELLDTKEKHMAYIRICKFTHINEFQ